MPCETIIQNLFCLTILTISVSGELVVQKYEATDVEKDSIDWVGTLDSAT